LEANRSPELALAAVREAFGCDYPEPAKLHGLRGMALYRLHRYPEAAASFRRARELDPAEPLYAQWADALDQDAAAPEAPAP
ncbi:MAG: tetratricopeptide repeat protein, partial [bacterium]